MQKTLRNRLLSKAVINWDTGCWEWVASRDRHGYGRITVDGKRALSHRVSFELVEGLIPEGLQLDHLCRVRHCINPGHLEPVTNRENQLRSPAHFIALNARKTHCDNGHEYTAENTRYRNNGWRECRKCWADQAKRHYWRKKEQLNADAKLAKTQSAK